MAETDVFERRVADALRAYATEMPAIVDAAAVADRVADERSRRWHSVTRRYGRLGLAWAAALLALLLVALLAAALFVGGWRSNEAIVMVPPPSPTATANPVQSDPEFNFATDNLCDWLTAEDMNRIVAAAQEQAGTDWPFHPYRQCVGPEAYDTTGYHWSWVGPGGMGLRVDLAPIAWYGHDRGTQPGPTAEVWSGHEMLDESVTYGNWDLHCSWLEITRGQLRVEGHEDEVLWFRLYRSDPTDECQGADDAYWARVKSLGFAVADAMLRDMNWVY